MVIRGKILCYDLKNNIIDDFLENEIVYYKLVEKHLGLTSDTDIGEQSERESMGSRSSAVSRTKSKDNSISGGASVMGSMMSKNTGETGVSSGSRNRRK
mmetsp:Transcript_106655/g.229647  ORF Transcript_106655/g.229647 Transcript_106655/m.229647 type:complete len:99 (-) Transcript_106655:1705-2001(-)